MMWHILQNGWEDKEFIAQRVYGFDDVRKEIQKWTPEEVERVSGVPGEQLKRIAEMFATQKPTTLIWCIGQTRHTVGTANVRASCIALLLTGNVGKPGAGASGRSITIICSRASTPRRSCRRRAIPLTHWFDAVLLLKDQVDQ